jgi:RNA polymerase subunit RPABC4/transcription elongation factor Spt4
MAATMNDPDYEVYCMACKKVVEDPTKVCPDCNSAEDMVDQPKTK